MELVEDVGRFNSEVGISHYPPTEELRTTQHPTEELRATQQHTLTSCDTTLSLTKHVSTARIGN